MPQNPLILGGRNFHLNSYEAKNDIIISDISGKGYSLFSFLLLEMALVRQMHLLHNLNGKAKMIISEDEWMPFRKKSFDAAISCLNSHWIENLKGK